MSSSSFGRSDSEEEIDVDGIEAAEAGALSASLQQPTCDAQHRRFLECVRDVTEDRISIRRSAEQALSRETEPRASSFNNNNHRCDGSPELVAHSSGTPLDARKSSLVQNNSKKLRRFIDTSPTRFVASSASSDALAPRSSSSPSSSSSSSPPISPSHEDKQRWAKTLSTLCCTPRFPNISHINSPEICQHRFHSAITLASPTPNSPYSSFNISIPPLPVTRPTNFLIEDILKPNFGVSSTSGRSAGFLVQSSTWNRLNEGRAPTNGDDQVFENGRSGKMREKASLQDDGCSDISSTSNGHSLPETVSLLAQRTCRYTDRKRGNVSRKSLRAEVPLSIGCRKILDERKNTYFVVASKPVDVEYSNSSVTGSGANPSQNSRAFRPSPDSETSSANSIRRLQSLCQLQPHHATSISNSSMPRSVAATSEDRNSGGSSSSSIHSSSSSSQCHNGGAFSAHRSRTDAAAEDGRAMQETDASSSSSSSSSSSVSSCSATSSFQPQGQLPAWVYCTRYSDRPSSGPRSRKSRPRTSENSEDKRPRTAFTADQLQTLKREFSANQYLNEERRQSLAAQLNLNETQIKIWFQNKRAKLKKASGVRNRLALELMAQGLYNHTTVTDNCGD